MTTEGERPLRIGFDVAQTCQERAGCGWYADALVRALVRVAPEHEYFLLHQFGEWINADTAAGTDVDHVPGPLRSLPAAEAAALWRAVAEGSATLPGNPDVVHSNCYQAPAVAPARLVFTVHDVSFWTHPEFHTEGNRLLCQRGLLRALRWADGFLFVSRSAHSDFETILPGWLDAQERPWTVIPEGARSLPAPVAGTAPGEEAPWLAVGSLEPRKNYETLLDALELYWSRSVHPRPLQIAGGAGWRSDALRQRLVELEARGRVRYLGYVPDERLAALYAGAVGLLFPSWHEGFGLPVLEAMSLGCPVACSDRSSLPETAGDAALYVDPSSAESICEVMLALENQSGLRARLSAAGRRRAAELNWEDAARATLAFYRRVLSAPVRRTR